MKTRCALLYSAIFCNLSFAVFSALAQGWTLTGAPTNNYWTSIVASADGTRLAAMAGSACYTSTNSGLTWSTNPFITFENGTLLAASADGLRLVAATANSGEIDVSTNGGLAWQKSTNYAEAAWQSIASSADGRKLILTEAGALVRASTNSGITWFRLVSMPNDGSAPEYAAMSADGNSLAISGFGYLFSTTNFGATWTTNILTTPCRQMAVSADGTKLVTAPYGGNIYTSTNSGATWIQQTNSPDLLWWSCASSADGTKLAAVSGTAGGSGAIYTSSDSGTSWVSNNVPVQPWEKIVSSPDGNLLAAIVNGNDPVAPGGIWIFQATPSPRLNVLPANGNLIFSWLVPSANFVLQECPDIGAGNWMTLTNLPALNLTNLQEQVTLAPDNGSGGGFFRLMAP